MTDTERERINAICEVAGVTDIDDLSDGFHTFRQLYYQRMMLFAVIVRQNKDKAWKSLRHDDGELCFGGGWFIVGIDTPEGSYTYHYDNKYFDLFDCEILDCGKHWDGHTEKDVTRLLSLHDGTDTNVGTTVSRQAAVELAMKYCPDDDGAVQCDGDIRELLDELENLPTAQPYYVNGFWLIRKWGDDARCSNCGHTFKDVYDMDNHDRFCRFCGSKMVGVKGETE